MRKTSLLELNDVVIGNDYTKDILLSGSTRSYIS